MVVVVPPRDELSSPKGGRLQQQAALNGQASGVSKFVEASVDRRIEGWRQGSLRLDSLCRRVEEEVEERVLRSKLSHRTPRAISPRCTSVGFGAAGTLTARLHAEHHTRVMRLDRKRACQAIHEIASLDKVGAAAHVRLCRDAAEVGAASVTQMLERSISRLHAEYPERLARLKRKRELVAATPLQTPSGCAKAEPFRQRSPWLGKMVEARSCSLLAALRAGETSTPPRLHAERPEKLAPQRMASFHAAGLAAPVRGSKEAEVLHTSPAACVGAVRTQKKSGGSGRYPFTAVA